MQRTMVPGTGIPHSTSRVRGVEPSGTLASGQTIRGMPCGEMVGRLTEGVVIGTA